MHLSIEQCTQKSNVTALLKLQNSYALFVTAAFDTIDHVNTVFRVVIPTETE